MFGMTTTEFLFLAAFLVCLSYLLVLYAFTAFFILASVFENRRRKTQAKTEDYDAALHSRFTIPVSVLVPAYNEQTGILDVARSLLRLDYPQFEVIIVNDGSKDATLHILKDEFDLQATQIFYRRSFVTARVRAAYRSRKDPRLLVIDKDNGGKADALNCAVNFARYRYLCCVDGDSVYTREALLGAMTLAAKDPANVLGITSVVAVGRQPNTGDDVEVGSKTMDRHVWTNLQHLEILRAYVNNRLAWSRMGFMMCVGGAFGVWRRDVIIDVGGFSSAFTCEDIEMTFRVLEKYRRERRPGRILSLPNVVGVTEGPERVAALISQRARWQRVTLETVWHYRRMFLNPRYGVVGTFGVPYILISECLGPFMQIFVIVTLIAAIVLHVLEWKQFLSLLGIQILALGILSTVSVWMNDWSFRYYKLRDVARLILIAPLDLVWYRPILTYAYFKGIVQFLRGDKSWDRFERNVRAGQSAKSA